MRDISDARRKTMSTAVARVNEAKRRAISVLKSDRFLADANWDVVSKIAYIRDPYMIMEESQVDMHQICVTLSIILLYSHA